jgi:hypothetical protein
MKHLKSTGVFCFVIGTAGIFEALGNNNEINLKYFFSIDYFITKFSVINPRSLGNLLSNKCNKIPNFIVTNRFSHS